MDSRSGRLRWVVVMPLVGAALLVAVLWMLGGGSWVTSPTIWGIVLFATLVLLVAARVGQRPQRLLLGLPPVVGGAAAVALGAWDYLPWVTSPALWLGILVSVVIGSWLVRTGRAQIREIVEGVLVGLIAFGLAIVAIYALVVFFSMVWRPFG